jgi:hypothetical protein
LAERKQTNKKQNHENNKKNPSFIYWEPRICAFDLHLDHNVYIAGHIVDDEGLHRAILWKNSEEIQLSTEESEACGVAVSGNDVYVDGYDYDHKEIHLPSR